jgi:hypothetical protein
VLGYAKDNVSVPPLPSSLEELRTRIIEEVASVDVDMIYRIWDEIDYRWDTCFVTRENHIYEYLQIKFKHIVHFVMYNNTAIFLLSVLLHLSFVQLI